MKIEPPYGCPLTPRVYETIVRVMRGATYKQVASDMCISLSTVRTHMHYAYEKLGVNTARQAYTVMLQNGWFARDEFPKGYEGKLYTIYRNKGVWTWLPSPAQRIYLNTFELFLRKRDEYHHSRTRASRNLLYFELERYPLRREANDFDGMIAKIAPVICTRQQLDILRAAHILT